jgi:hypothetical protein
MLGTAIKITDGCSIGKDPEIQDNAEITYNSGIFLRG